MNSNTSLTHSSSGVSPSGAGDNNAETKRLISSQLRGKKNDVLVRWKENQFSPALMEKFRISGNTDAEDVRQSFVSSLFDLFCSTLENSRSGCREVYLDERLRYAPHREDPAIVIEFFNDILEQDEAAVLDILAPALRQSTASLMADLHAPLRCLPRKDAVRLLAVGDCLLNELRVFLPDKLRQSGNDLDMRCLYFSALMGSSLSTAQVVEFIAKMSPQLIAFSFLSYAGLPPYTALIREADKLNTAEMNDRITGIMAVIREYLTAIREQTDAVFLVHNASGLPLTGIRRRVPFLPPLSRGKREVVRLINLAIAEYCVQAENTLLLDEYAVATKLGYRECSQMVISSRVTRDGFFHTSRFGEFLTVPYLDIIKSYRQLRKVKVLLIDFDNTLWEGVMADGPVRHHIERQQLLRTLKDSGMVLVSVSKNTMENVRWEEMYLKQDDFALHKISWDMKVKSISATADELDLGLDSFVLIDDNPVERDFVNQELPMVHTLDANKPETWDSLRRLLDFPNTQTTEEAKSRTEMYRAQAQRREAQSKSLDYPSMMRSLRLKAAFGKARPQDLDRLVELVQRTNQFNTTTIRYTRQELKSMLGSSAQSIYVADLSDKFGKYGLVAVAIVDTSRDMAEVVSFVMSCRAMGFGLEQLMLVTVLQSLQPVFPVTGRFIPTDRNTPAANLFKETGFIEIEQGLWRVERFEDLNSVPDWIEIVERKL